MSSPVKSIRGPKVGVIRREINFWFDDRKELTHIFNKHRASSEGRYVSRFYDDTKAGIRTVLVVAMLKPELGSVIKKDPFYYIDEKARKVIAHTRRESIVKFSEFIGVDKYGSPTPYLMIIRPADSKRLITAFPTDVLKVTVDKAIKTSAAKMKKKF